MDCKTKCEGLKVWDSEKKECVKAPVCGDGEIDTGETCDDGNIVDGDQCSLDCKNVCVEPEVWRDNTCQIKPKCEESQEELDGQCVAKCPTGYFRKGGYCVKDFLGGSIHPMAIDSECIGIDIVYSGPQGYDDVGPRTFYLTNGNLHSDNHDGTDIRTVHKEASCQVNAAADGTIVRVTQDGYGGQYTDINHAGGYMTRYLHGKNQLFPNQLGTLVNMGDYVFTQSNTGFNAVHHLHFGLFLNGKVLDGQNPSYFGYLGDGYSEQYLPEYGQDLSSKIYNNTKRY